MCESLDEIFYNDTTRKIKGKNFWSIPVSSKDAEEYYDRDLVKENNYKTNWLNLRNSWQYQKIYIISE